MKINSTRKLVGLQYIEKKIKLKICVFFPTNLIFILIMDWNIKNNKKQ